MATVISLSQQALAEAADANFVTHAGWVQRRGPGMHVVEDESLVLVDSGLACDTYNLICRARLDLERAPSRIREAIDYFTGVGRPFSWWVGPADQPGNLAEFLIAAGLHHAEGELAMSADLRQLTLKRPLPDGLRIERVRTAVQLHEYAQILAVNPVLPDPPQVRFYEQAAPWLLAAESPYWFYVGYYGELPVATAELTVSDGVVGLYGVSTLEGYRRRGFGGAMTLRPLGDAQSAGHAVAVLQASAQGVSVYQRIGFQVFGAINEYKPQA